MLCCVSEREGRKIGIGNAYVKNVLYTDRLGKLAVGWRERLTHAHVNLKRCTCVQNSIHTYIYICILLFKAAFITHTHNSKHIYVHREFGRMTP